MASSLVLYAPNVHTGGGLVLLRALLHDWPVGHELRAVLDQRAADKIDLPVLAKVLWTRPTLASRLEAERQLVALVRPGDAVLCFHGLPPLFRNAGRVLLFQQNRLLLGLMRLRDFSLRTGLRVAAERWISHAFRHRVAEYIVQTTGMARSLTAWHGGRPQVRVLPFGAEMTVKPRQKPEWDFVYVSDGLPHKNHARLLQAWVELAAEGVKPSLVLTLGPRDKALAEQVAALAHERGVNIQNVGHVDHDAVMTLYARSRALIFPSLGESFGLPLLEARAAGLPILAPELDYVRDVCDPVQTFDPQSPVSIARAVRRFLQQAEPLPLPGPAADFWAALGLSGDERALT
jgi:glycosyltransferase involved in cell wall biosynthesis